jgi:undecaprenyl-diphosphatase
MISWLNHIDTELFLFINGLHASWLDGLMWGFSQISWLWIPLYAFLTAWIWIKYKIRSIPIILSFVILVILADQTASAILKPLIERLRPTHNDTLKGLVHIVNGYEGGLYGFASSHAANTFAVALLFSMIIREKRIISPLFTWALLVSYSRIYLGVHYPGDVLGGFVIGAVYAFLIYKLLEFVFRKIYHDDLHHSAQR